MTAVELHAGDEWRAAVRHAGQRRNRWRPLPHQVPPNRKDPPEVGWLLWLLLAGRGAGKTDACASYMTDHVKGPACDRRVPGGHRMAIIAPTLGDGLDACVNGPSGLKAHDPAVRSVQTTGGTFVRWPSGAEAKLFGAHTPEDVERLRAGGNRCLVWAEELAAWRYLADAWQHMRYGLRVGAWPHAIASTTPKNRAHLRALIADERTRVSTASTDANPHLADDVRAQLFADYGGTRLGRQELLGELLTDVEGALWSEAMIGDHRAETPSGGLGEVVVGVDPPASSTGAECGIVVAGSARPPSEPDPRRKHLWVLDDRSLRGSPEEWATAAVNAYRLHRADRIVAEVNNGGDMVAAVIRNVDPNVTVESVRATRGKALRAEPVAGLYEQGRVHHTSVFVELEEQQTTWVPGEESPDRLDALVWAATSLLPDLTNLPSSLLVSRRRLARPDPMRSRSMGRRLASGPPR